jgi:hypothetical protein
MNGWMGSRMTTGSMRLAGRLEGRREILCTIEHEPNADCYDYTFPSVFSCYS